MEQPNIKYICYLPNRDIEKFIKENIFTRSKSITDIEYISKRVFAKELEISVEVMGYPKDSRKVQRLAILHYHLDDFNFTVKRPTKTEDFSKQWSKYVYERLKFYQGASRYYLNENRTLAASGNDFSAEEYKDEYKAYHNLVAQEKISEIQNDLKNKQW